jgi:hypothetical protein
LGGFGDGDQSIHKYKIGTPGDIRKARIAWEGLQTHWDCPSGTEGHLPNKRGQSGSGGPLHLWQLLQAELSHFHSDILRKTNLMWLC